MNQNILLPTIMLVAVSAGGCRDHDNSIPEAAMHIAAKLKHASPNTTDAVKLRAYVIQGKKDLLITATLVEWNSKDDVNREFMRALAYDYTRAFACKDKALSELLAEGVELTVMYASNDDKDSIGVTIIKQSCDDIVSNPPLVGLPKRDKREADTTSCTPVGTARKTNDGTTLSVLRCTKSDGSVKYVTKLPGS